MINQVFFYCQNLCLHVGYGKYYNLRCLGNYFSFTCLPNGLSSGPYIFTKIMKPIIAEMRKRGFLNSIFIDDSLLLGNTVKECKGNVLETEGKFNDLGFLINNIKSIKKPCQEIQHL